MDTIFKIWSNLQVYENMIFIFLCFWFSKSQLKFFKSWIKGNKLHSKKNIDKCHIWISFIIFNPTSKFRKTQFLCFYVVYFLMFLCFPILWGWIKFSKRYPCMAFVNKHYGTSIINFDPIYKSYLFTAKVIKTLFLTKRLNLHGLISWIKGYKLHNMKKIDKCHIWISFTKFDPTSNFRKT